MPLIISAIDLYTSGDISVMPCGGWDIEILAPNKDVVCTLHEDASDQNWSPYVEQLLREKAATLLNHLNRFPAKR
jgi:hypothetical protein